MPWQERTIMSSRKEFVTLALNEGTSFSELCRRYNISRKTGYKWLNRYNKYGDQGLSDRSRRPKTQPRRCSAQVEQAVIDVRHQYPTWGSHKLRKVLLRKRDLQFKPPASSTITAILRRNNLIDDRLSQKKPVQRFERESPNELWQMDFKGHFPIAGIHCHPLTILDDCSRYNLCLQACSNERGVTVKQKLTNVFRRYGMPDVMLTDNGPPWGSTGVLSFTPLSLWLMRLGIKVIHGRPYHPQTQGKEERFHLTLKIELIKDSNWRDLTHCQKDFDDWRQIYNFERPHQALDYETPGSVYQASKRSFPEVLPEIEYAPDCEVRKVQDCGIISFRNKEFKTSKALKGYQVGLRPTLKDGIWEVYFYRQKVSQIDLRYPDKPKRNVDCSVSSS